MRSFFAVAALLALTGVYSLQECVMESTTLQFLTHPDYQSRMTQVLTGVCKKNQTDAGFRCEDKIKPLASVLTGFSQMLKDCTPAKSDGRHVLERLGFSDIPQDFLAHVGEINNSSALALTSDPYSCGSKCTFYAMTECTFYCAYAISVCSEIPYSSKCINAAYKCFYEMPVCCTCGASMHLYTCSVCGY